MIQLKRVYDAADVTDGYRVLIDRLWPRGIKKEALQLDEWCKALAPSGDLRKALHSEVIDFSSFRQRYLAELEQLADEGLRIAGLAQRGTVTLLYAAKADSQNHAQVLAGWLRGLKA
ncbi:DUF488 domain-containing protein [Pluralibacter gergoviae]|uniref:DUF488 domain-containing protein n=1 Tax=Pluralibacter gergoviae TaxID=61647 RepID=UPI0006AC4000|nr:DUF488 family protein [Pluralibacter gergoviae]KOQ99683.1 MarR family transcriptional regulator [Pluralibacter gergoviae]